MEICTDSHWKCLLKVVVHGVNFHVGHPFHGDVVVAMVELQHCLGTRTIMGLNEPLVTGTSAPEWVMELHNLI